MSQVEKEIHEPPEALERLRKNGRETVEETTDNDPDQPRGLSRVTETR